MGKDREKKRRTNGMGSPGLFSSAAEYFAAWLPLLRGRGTDEAPRIRPSEAVENARKLQDFCRCLNLL